MSLEQAMEKQAAAAERLATAMNRYADVIEKFGLKIENDNAAAAAAGGAETTTKAEKPAKAEKATKAAKADKTPPAESDGFDDEPTATGAPKDLTIDKVKAKLFEVKDAYGDKTPALKISTDLGYPSINDIKPVDFEKVWIAAEAAIAKAP